MWNYVLRRLILLPFTLFFIILINFVIMCMAPSDPLSVTEITEQGATKKEGQTATGSSERRYLQFREFYGLTLPILFNSWPFLSDKEVRSTLHTLAFPGDLPFKEQEDLRVLFGDQARFIMPYLLKAINDPNLSMAERKQAQNYFIRGTYRLGFSGNKLSDEEKEANKKISYDSDFLSQLPFDPPLITRWYEANKTYYQFEPTTKEKVYDLFLTTRFSRYMSRVLTLDFGTLRNDSNKTVISEVVKRFKYSLTLSLIPMVITLFLSLFFGMLMAVYKNTWADFGPHFIFLILFAIPVFVAAPFLIENFAFGKTFPFTNIPVPSSGFTSPDSIYNQLSSFGKLIDVLKHIALPLLAILYGSLAVQARLSRTAFLENLKKDYVKAAWVRGVPKSTLLIKHVGRNAAITLVTSVAGSLGVILGGSLIVETLFDIDGFGRFFYEAILNRDYNVIMFSALAGSFLTLLGYLVADISYMLLDPRVRLDS